MCVHIPTYTLAHGYERILVKLSFPAQSISKVSLWRVFCVDANMLAVVKTW